MPKQAVTRRVVITGYGMITPLGRDAEETFQKASQGISGIDTIKSFDTRGLPCQIGGEVNDAWIDETPYGTSRRFQAYSSRGLRLMIIAAAEAAVQARLDAVADRSTVGVSLGSHGDNPSVEDMMFLHKFYDGGGRWDMEGMMQTGGYSFLNFFRRKPDVATALLANLFDCTGPTLSITSACAAGAQAIGEAYRMIREGRCRVMIAGGCEAVLNFFGVVGFILIKALAEKYSAPQKASRPFDRKRNGFVMSEGAGAVVLEDLEHARSRGADIFGELLGYGASADAYRITDIHPKAEGAILAMGKAISESGLTPADIDYINAHGTSTIQNDIVETRAIKEVFGERSKEIPVSSNKSMLGHTIAAAGAIECVLTLLGINRSLILPTINYEYPDPKCDLDYVPNTARQKDHERALSNSFGFGGQNACLCIGKFKE